MLRSGYPFPRKWFKSRRFSVSTLECLLCENVSHFENFLKLKASLELF